MIVLQNQNNFLWKSLDSLFKWVKKNNYIGWDLYDGLNSFQLKKLFHESHFFEMAFIQFNVYSPFNLRSLFKINKGKDIKGVALFAQAYYNLYKLTGKIEYKNEFDKCISFLINKSLKKNYDYDCWSSHYYDYYSINKTKINADNPDIIGSSRAIIALTQSYKISKDEKLKDMIDSGVLFLIEKLFEKINDDYYFKYTLFENNNTLVPNASAQGLECLSYVLSLKSSRYIEEVCEKIINSLIKYQNKDGSWVYSIDIKGKKRNQIDFHQGYILDGLLSYMPYSYNKKTISDSIKKGLKFYKDKQFFNNGQSFYRYPIKFPVDIHNQAQGIITFSKFNYLDEINLEYAKKICIWTIENMQSIEGYFFTHKWPGITNKIPYMRWGQAWMMLALSTFLKNYINNKSNID